MNRNSPGPPDGTNNANPRNSASPRRSRRPRRRNSARANMTPPLTMKFPAAIRVNTCPEGFFRPPSRRRNPIGRPSLSILRILAINHDRARLEGGGAQQGRDGAVTQPVVGVEEHQPFPGGGARACIPGRRDAPAIIRNQSNSAVRKGANDGVAPVDRSIVDDDQFAHVGALSDHARNGLVNERGGVLAGMMTETDTRDCLSVSVSRPRRRGARDSSRSTARPPIPSPI